MSSNEYYNREAQFSTKRDKMKSLEWMYFFYFVNCWEEMYAFPIFLEYLWIPITYLATEKTLINASQIKILPAIFSEYIQLNKKWGI